MSQKKKDDKNRWRNKTVAFRSSPEEAAELDRRWRLCGYLTKQDYILDSVLHQQVEARCYYQYQRLLIPVKIGRERRTKNFPPVGIIIITNPEQLAQIRICRTRFGRRE